ISLSGIQFFNYAGIELVQMGATNDDALIIQDDQGDSHWVIGAGVPVFVASARARINSRAPIDFEGFGTANFRNQVGVDRFEVNPDGMPAGMIYTVEKDFALDPVRRDTLQINGTGAADNPRITNLNVTLGVPIAYLNMALVEV